MSDQLDKMGKAVPRGFVAILRWFLGNTVFQILFPAVLGIASGLLRRIHGVDPVVLGAVSGACLAVCALVLVALLVQAIARYLNGRRVLPVGQEQAPQVSTSAPRICNWCGSSIPSTDADFGWLMKTVYCPKCGHAQTIYKV